MGQRNPAPRMVKPLVTRGMFTINWCMISEPSTAFFFAQRPLIVDSQVLGYLRQNSSMITRLSVGPRILKQSV